MEQHCMLMLLVHAYVTNSQRPSEERHIAKDRHSQNLRAEVTSLSIKTLMEGMHPSKSTRACVSVPSNSLWVDE